MPTPVEIEKPIFYEQIKEFVHDVRCEVEKVVPVYEEKVRIQEVPQQVVVFEEVAKEIPG